MKLARRVEALPPYLFAEISKKIAAKRAKAGATAAVAASADDEDFDDE